MYIRDVLNITYCIDECKSSGKYFSLLLNMLQDLSENLERLLEKPDIPEKAIKELTLADLTKYKSYPKLKKKK